MSIVGIIPARYASTRFPGKPLIDLQGKAMIERVFAQCEKAQSLDYVIVATDDQRIYDAVKAFGGNVMMTKNSHKSGTERCAEVVNHLSNNYDYAINIQGDEPLINPQQIDDLGRLLIENDAKIATLARPITKIEEIESPNVVKVVVNQKKQALYFSRSIIPYERNSRTQPVLQHIGIYGYHTQTLKEIVELPASSLEEIESLEQLRWLDSGYSVHVGLSNYPTIAIDSPEDVAEVLKHLPH